MREIGGHRQRLVAHADALRRILRHVAVDGDDHRDRLARVAHLLAGERVLRARGDQTLVRREQRQRLAEAAVEVLVRVDGEHAVDVERARDVDVGDPRVRVLGAHERHLRGAVLEVVGEASAAGEQPRVLAALDRLAEHPRRHLASSIAAAARTASTIPT